MENTQDALAAVVGKETWTAEDHKELVRQLFSTHDAPRKFKTVVAEMEASNPQPRGSTALKIGIARYMLSRFGDALEALAEATDNKDRHYFQALCYKNLRRYDKAAEEIERARSGGWDALEVDTQMVEILALSGQFDAAAKTLGKIQNKLGQTAEFFYLRGLIEELQGRHEEATASYISARQQDPNHAAATFRLAYHYDLYGDEQQAVDLYRECLSHPPIHANALMNLAVLYEDAGKYDQAITCLRKVLSNNPNHPRARLFLKDCEDSQVMYFDEDRAKRMARRNAVLDIPVTDFELSVRARNCLKKMNIRTLGDLVRTSEAELLAYKNFGETSLKEIKDMLSAKGLRLGQPLDDESPMAKPEAVARPAAPAANEGVLATPLSQIDFSIRARKAMEALKVNTIGELASKSEADLLACRNFGQTSLNEIRQRLAEYGLTLREQS